MHNLITMFLDASANVSGTVSGAANQTPAPWYASFISLLPLLLLAVVFYFFIYRPQKKQDQEMRDMRNSLAVGDIITTSGGIIGKVIRIKDNAVVIESGGQKLLIQRWAIRSIDEKAHSEGEDE